MNQHDFSYLKLSLLLKFGQVEAEILRLEQKAETKQDIFNPFSVGSRDPNLSISVGEWHSIPPPYNDHIIKYRDI